jgi:uncharacterized protein (TIGR03118 family)
LTPRAGASAPNHYEETDLVFDVPDFAAATDPHLVNAWGLARSASSPWWVADNGTGLATIYNGAGAVQSLVVTIPVVSGTEPAAPTGIVSNNSTDFEVAPTLPARFLFVTEEGTLSGWNPTANPTTAIIKVDGSGKAVYKGLTIAQVGAANFLYAANFMTGAIDVFDASFAPVALAAGAFTDPKLPKRYAPFNVQTIGANVWVMYAKRDEDSIDEVAGAGRGFVDAFSPDGVLQKRLEWGPWMNAPWGIALAPADFGRFGGMLLVGQFGSGKIAAFDPVSGRFRGFLRGERGRALRIDGLWALGFGNDGNAGPASTLFFTAGIEDEAHGLFGTITPHAAGKNDNNNQDDDEDGANDDGN